MIETQRNWDFSSMQKQELQRKQLLSQYKNINIFSLLLLVAFLALGVFQFFFKMEGSWVIIVLCILALGLLLSSWRSQLQLKHYQKFFKQTYLAALTQIISPKISYLKTEEFDLHKIPGLNAKEEQLELEEKEHYIYGKIQDEICFHFIRLKVLEWQGKKRKKSSIRFEGLFLRIEGLKDLDAIIEQEIIQSTVKQLGESWGMGAEVRATSDQALILYIYTEKTFWNTQPNEHLKDTQLSLSLVNEFLPIFDFVCKTASFSA